MIQCVKYVEKMLFLYYLVLCTRCITDPRVRLRDGVRLRNRVRLTDRVRVPAGTMTWQLKKKKKRLVVYILDHVKMPSIKKAASKYHTMYSTCTQLGRRRRRDRGGEGKEIQGRAEREEEDW